jgi:hypothetical protein
MYGKWRYNHKLVEVGAPGGSLAEYSSGAGAQQESRFANTHGIPGPT